MLFSQTMLTHCQQIWWMGCSCTLQPGDRVARGFADLGFEEFWVLPNEKVVSLLTGDVSPFRESDWEHFFKIFSLDDLLFELEAFGTCKISKEGNSWRVQVVGTPTDCTESSLYFAALRALHSALKISNPLNE